MAWGGGSSSVFKQSIEGRIREHMHFIDNIDFVLPQVGREVDLIAQVAHIIDAGVGSCIDFDQIQEASLVDSLAMVTLVARSFGSLFSQAVDRFCQQAGRGGFSSAAWTSK